ncbi:unnamed protein product [Trifolium pratense]|uniref:Uncharacterized protein n=1 Tax=Trifolium pratense TaxID=57577 RepID=A0ACB0IZP1_TRIPR|nr:unnamed protein product [Trifolium pratense]
MLLRNLDPRYGLCNGTRLLCRGLFMNMLDVQILTGSNAGKRAFLPRIKSKTSASSGLPFVLSRKQFPVRLSFAITINKSQGQTIPNVGIYLPSHVFSHGQLYVALSRGVSQNSTKLLIRDGKLQDNIRYREIFQLCHELKTKKFDAYFDNQEGDFQKRWNTWKDEQSMSSINKVDNKVHRLRVYSVGWGATVITDKTQLWNMVKREILSQRTTRNIQNVAASISNHSHKSFKLKQDISILQFFKSKQFIDKAIYGELVRIFARILE